MLYGRTETTDANGEKMCVERSPKRAERIIPDGVKTIANDCFDECDGLTRIEISSSVTGIESEAFCRCGDLESITVDGGNRNFCSRDGILYDKAKAEILHIPQAINGAVAIPDGVTRIRRGAFSFCEGLSSITIGDGVTSIGEDAFSYCCGLTEITVSRGNVKYHSANDCLIETETKRLVLGCKNSVIPRDGSVTSIGDDAFYGCCGLTCIAVPSAVTSIGCGAFAGCDTLESVEIPSEVTSIGECAFFGCVGLSRVEYCGTTAQWNAIAKDGWSDSSGIKTVVCADGEILL